MGRFGVEWLEGEDWRFNGWRRWEVERIVDGKIFVVCFEEVMREIFRVLEVNYENWFYFLEIWNLYRIEL